MGHIFKKKYRAKDPKTGKVQLRESKKWWLEYWCKATRKRVRKVGYTDKKATEHELHKLEREADQVESGYLPAGAGLAKVAMVAHLETYLTHLLAQNDTPDHVALVGNRCRTILEGAKIAQWRDLDPLVIEAFLLKLRTEPRQVRGVNRSNQTHKPISIRTSNHYLSQFKAFVVWMAGRMKCLSPLEELSPLNPATDLRRVRRVLTAADFARLVTTTTDSTEVVCDLPGPDRAILYVLAAYTGLRASELASLTPESLRMAGGTVTVQAGYSKRRRLDVVPIPPVIAVQVAEWLAGKAAGKLLWPGSWADKGHAATMLREDLAAAGIPFEADGKVFDFHALRHSYITYLVQAGVPLAQAQALARHSTPVLTAKHYLHLETEQLAAEAAKLPALLPAPKSGGQNGQHSGAERGEPGQKRAS